MTSLATQPIDDDEPFCQGDILVRDVSGEGYDFEAYLIITADCDIAQKKMGSNFTVLPVKQIRDYIKYDWADVQLSKQLFDLSEKLSHFLKEKHIEDASAMSGVGVRDWIGRRGAESVVTAFQINEKSDAYSYCSAIERILRRESSDVIPLSALDDVWNILGKTEKSKKYLIKDAVSRKTVSSHVQIVVDIMDRNYDMGYYIDLRDVKAIPHSQCFMNQTDLRVAGETGKFYRVSRLSDPLKYLVVQKFANLFSRIGMDEWLEKEHDALADLLPDSFLTVEVAP